MTTVLLRLVLRSGSEIITFRLFCCLKCGQAELPKTKTLYAGFVLYFCGRGSVSFDGMTVGCSVAVAEGLWDRVWRVMNLEEVLLTVVGKLTPCCILFRKHFIMLGCPHWDTFSRWFTVSETFRTSGDLPYSFVLSLALTWLQESDISIFCCILVLNLVCQPLRTTSVFCFTLFNSDPELFSVMNSEWPMHVPINDSFAHLPWPYDNKALPYVLAETVCSDQPVVFIRCLLPVGCFVNCDSLKVVVVFL